MQTSVLEYLENSSLLYANKVAFFDIDEEITFAELRRRSVSLGATIMKTGLGRCQPILVYLPKSVKSIVSLMGILYSGNFYSPTDVRFPAEKVHSIINVLQPRIVIVDAKSEKKFDKIDPDNTIRRINIDEIEIIKDYSIASIMIKAILDVDPVYTFFTSGSTGAPKGVVINNRNIIDYTDWAVKALHINDKTIIGSQAPIYFDLSTHEIYTTLKMGGTMGIIPVTYFAFPVRLLEFIRDHHVNSVYWVPSVFVSIANYDLLKAFDLNELETIIFGGEVMPVKQLNYWRNHVPSLKLIANVYGPTEATVNCTYYIIDRDFEDDEVLPLGKACENVGLIILDDEDRKIEPDRINVEGEICVYGASLSSGYWNDEAKTAEKFVRNPLCPAYKEIMYRTGDLAFYNERGEVVFAGRKDFQIKHSGYRIELGEVETAAMGMKELTNVCASYDNDKKQIVLFYSGDASEDEVRDFLVDVIPRYMMPSLFHKLARFPYNDNGKIDRKALENYIYETDNSI